MTSKSNYSIIHKFFVLALSLVALTIAGNQIYNYSQFRTTIATKSEFSESFPYPSISFCPGFHDHRRHDFPWFLPRRKMDYFRKVENFPRTRVTAQKLWNEVTYDVKDFLRWVEITYENETVETMPSSLGGECLKVSQLDTMSGKCYTLTLNCSSQVNKYFLDSFSS